MPSRITWLKYGSIRSSLDMSALCCGVYRDQGKLATGSRRPSEFGIVGFSQCQQTLLGEGIGCLSHRPDAARLLREILVVHVPPK
jgi:hypothetical protein